MGGVLRKSGSWKINVKSSRGIEREEGLYSRMEGKERGSSVMDGGKEGVAMEKCGKKSETEISA